MKLTPVIVRWLDAHQGEGYWHALEDDNDDPHIISTCGWLIAEADGGKKNHVTVAQNLDPNGLVDHVIYIPAGMVDKVQVIASSIDL